MAVAVAVASASSLEWCNRERMLSVSFQQFNRDHCQVSVVLLIVEWINLSVVLIVL